MTTRKIVVIIVSVVMVLALVAVLVVGGIVGAVFYGISNSDAAGIAKEFLRNNEKLKQDIGEVKDFGSFITGNVNVANGDGNAQLNLKVIGERTTVNATVELIFRSGHQWRVMAASYRNEAGETVDLFNPYDTPQATSQAGKASRRLALVQRGDCFPLRVSASYFVNFAVLPNVSTQSTPGNSQKDRKA